MYKNKKVIIVLPAYNAARTLSATLSDIPSNLVDEIILCDDNSTDNTVELAHTLNIKHIITHNTNRGYGANQKSLYQKALDLGGDIIIMLHPDYQYTPKLIGAMVYVENKHGLFSTYKSITDRISSIVSEINPDYKYPNCIYNDRRAASSTIFCRSLTRSDQYH